MTTLFQNYLQKNNFTQFDLKAILFDMDGVLYDSMPAHAKSWQETMVEFGFQTTRPEDFYMHEGRPADSTINLYFRKERSRDGTTEEIKEIYLRKTELFRKYHDGAVMPSAKEALDFTRQQGLLPVLVTGSKQPSLLENLNQHFPGVFSRENMVTAFDTKIGKPDPEPFLMGLEKAGNLKPNQALAIENAPLGTESATKAGLFTICVNTGPLPDKALTDAGANIVFSTITELLESFPEILRIASTLKNNNL